MRWRRGIFEPVIVRPEIVDSGGLGGRGRPGNRATHTPHVNDFRLVQKLRRKRVCGNFSGGIECPQRDVGRITQAHGIDDRGKPLCSLTELPGSNKKCPTCSQEVPRLNLTHGTVPTFVTCHSGARL